MIKLFSRIYQICIKKGQLKHVLRSSNTEAAASIKPRLRFQRDKKLNISDWCLLSIPITTFALGTWQVKRKKWKDDLVEKLKLRVNADPMMLPESPEEINKLEYYPVHIRGEFLHDKEVYMGPRVLIKNGDSASGNSLISAGHTSLHGFLVITPFKLENREEIILINRGWVPIKNKHPRTRAPGQISGTVDLIGHIRLQENRAPLMPKDIPKNNTWLYRNINEMSEVTGADCIFLDATDDFDVKNGPIGSQTRVHIRNEHLSYIITWYGLSLFTGIMWYNQIFKRVMF